MTEHADNADYRYFISYSGIKLPLKLVTPITAAELQNRNTYFRACFDEQQRLTQCQQLVYGEIELQHCYCYHDNGVLKSAEITDADGEVHVLAFDENGQPVEAID
jgi:hypothetical protein